jgi:hypothetical protein
MNAWLTTSALLVLFCAEVMHAQSSVDSVFRVVDSLYTSGAYSRVELAARRLLENEMLGDSVSLVAEQWLAFALVAEGEPALAREHFARILRRRPQYTLDPALTSPKILAVFNEAQGSFRAAKTQGVDRQALPEVSLPGGITYRTILFPGWEQLYRGRTTVGAVFLSAGVAALGAGVVLDFVRRSAREDYLAATAPEEIESKYQRYNRASRGEGWAFGSFAAIYLLSEVDVFTHASPLSLQVAGPGSPGLRLSLSLR